jgi:hypothetical protein
LIVDKFRASRKTQRVGLHVCSLGGLPLILLTRKNLSNDESQQQISYLQLSRSSKQIIAVHGEHFIQLERPDLIIDAVNDVLAVQAVSQ